MIQLLEIWLNHDTSSAAADALNIRVNFDEAVPLPEWSAGQPAATRPAAAYTIAAGAAGPTIRVKLGRSAQDPQRVEIRAIQGGTTPNFLGEVASTLVDFGQATQTGLVSFPLAGVTLDAVGVHHDRWKWQWRSAAGGAWTQFADTRIRIYCLVDVPQSPWTQSLADATQCPWTDVLDWTCEWAAGETTADGVAGRVTQAAFDLGRGRVIKYYPSDSRPSFSRFDPYQFDCGLFLSVLADPPAPPQRVNCMDCASILTTFANAAGCSLMDVVVGCSFQPNRILLVGNRRTTDLQAAFQFHEVAWDGRKGVAARVWDSCLMVDGDDDPGVGKFNQLLPVKQPFRLSGSLQYLERLVDPADQALTALRPSVGNRRLGRSAIDPPRNNPCLPLPMFKAGPDRHLVTPFPLVGNELPGWLLRTVTALDDSNPPRWLRSGWSRGSDQELELLELETFVADSELAAARRLWRALGDFELATMTDDSVGPGEARSANDDHTVIIFRRANVVAAVANDRQYTRPIRDAAADFDAVLIHMSR